MKLTAEQIEELSEYEEILLKFKDKVYGAVNPDKSKELIELYNKITKQKSCSSCNYRWLNRLSLWYYKNKEE